MEEILTKIEEYSDYHHWDFSNQRTLLAVSGGRDSMTLLAYFHHSGFPCEVAHLNYGLRPKEADYETKLVQDVCDQYGITCYVSHPPTQQFAEEKKLSIQEAARILRYDFFRQLTKEKKLKYIATAHHMDDNVETLLMRLSDGAGLRGLSGIPPQNGQVIRPFLSLTSEDMHILAQGLSVKHLEDSSNTSDYYLRNKVRHHIIPVLKKEFGHKYNQISLAIKHLQESNEIYATAMLRKIKKLEDHQGDLIRYRISRLLAQSPLDTILYECFKRYGLKAAQLSELKKIITTSSGKLLETDTHLIVKDREYLLVGIRKAEGSSLQLFEINDCKMISQNKTLTVSESVAKKAKKNDEYFFKRNKIQFPLTVRPWMKGDYFYPEGLNKKKKISDFFGDNKLNFFEKKERIILSDAQGHILAVLGYRADGRYLADEGIPAYKVKISVLKK